MGPYLAKPVTTIHTSTAENDRYVYCTAEMQGWRKTQEDAHTALLNYDDTGSAFFAVFDGHGGEEVSKYCSIYLPAFIKRSKLYEEDSILQLLKTAFLEFDRTLKDPDVINELRKLASLDELEDIAPDETDILKKEAQMPLNQVIPSEFTEILSKEPKNGENSEEIKNNSESEQISKDQPADGNSSEKEKNGNSADSANHEESKEDKKEITLEASSSSGISKLAKVGKSQALKVLNKQIYEAFLQDFDSEDDEEDEENEEFEGASSEDNEDDDDEENEDDDAEEESDDDDDNESGAVDPSFANAYITPGGGSGCTAIVALVRNNILYVANVGDSRCVLSRDGAAIEMSEDHKPEDENEKARIVKAGGEVTADGRVNGGLNLSRAIGDHLYKKNEKLTDEEQMVTSLPDVRTRELDTEKDQFLFLACDGIWNSMSSQEAVDFINERMKKNMALKTICEELFNVCLAPNTDGDGSGCDNMTCILVKFKKSTDPKRSLEESSDDHSEPSTKKAKVEEAADLYKPGPSKV